MLYAYPESTYFGHKIKKKDLSKQKKPTSKQQELLTKQLDKIIWAYKLAANTLNIQASADLPEIQVIQLVLKTEITSVNEALLHYLDSVIPSALLFEIHSKAGIQMVACLKEWNAKGAIKCSPYLYGAQVTYQAPRQDLPVSRDFKHLYQQLLIQLLAYPLKVGESLHEVLERSKQLDSLAKTISQLEKKLLNKKTQFNKRIEINQQLKEAKQKQEELLS